MSTKAKAEALQVLKEAINEFESQKGSILSGIQKLSRASKLLNIEKVYLWCEIQLGNPYYTQPLEKYFKSIIKFFEKKKLIQDDDNKIIQLAKPLEDIGLILNQHYTINDLAIKGVESGGGFKNIGFIEEKYADLVRRKVGNDGTYYKTNLNNHLNHVRRVAHKKAINLYNDLAFSEAPQTCFDILKDEVDDKLLDINPELAEKIMIAFKGITTDTPEEWSQSLTTCRRIIESLADTLYPPTENQLNGRSLRQQNYINRLWAFMDQAIESDSNKELAKAHIDFLGHYLQRTHKISNKGVHTEITRIEAIKAVFHTYLIVADILTYLNIDQKKIKGKLNIHSASIDELQTFLDINKNIAKEIIKLRVSKETLELKDLSCIKGIGAKTLTKAERHFSFDPVE